MTYVDALEYLDMILERDQGTREQRAKSAGGGLRGFHERMKKRVGIGAR